MTSPLVDPSTLSADGTIGFSDVTFDSDSTTAGLDAAVSALIARCPVPVDMQSDLTRRLSPPTEASAYFVIAEALTNIAKHSHATRATVRLLDRGQRLIVEIHPARTGSSRLDGAGSIELGHRRVLAVLAFLRNWKVTH